MNRCIQIDNTSEILYLFNRIWSNPEWTNSLNLRRENLNVMVKNILLFVLVGIIYSLPRILILLPPGEKKLMLLPLNDSKKIGVTIGKSECNSNYGKKS